MALPKIVQAGTSLSKPERAGGYSVQPESWSLRVQLPFGGYVWNRPVAIWVDDGERLERIGITDVTRIIQLTLLALSGLFLVVGWLAGRRR